MKLISLLFCFMMAEETLVHDKIIITEKSKVEIYSAYFWAPCKEAKALLQSRGIEYTTKSISFSRKTVEEMIKRTRGKKSVPQIFVDDKYFGGLMELKKLFDSTRSDI